MKLVRLASYVSQVYRVTVVIAGGIEGHFEDDLTIGNLLLGAICEGVIPIYGDDSHLIARYVRSW